MIRITTTGNCLVGIILCTACKAAVEPEPQPLFAYYAHAHYELQPGTVKIIGKVTSSEVGVSD